MPKKNKSGRGDPAASDDGWLASLARQAAASTTTSAPRKGAQTTPAPTTTKAERIERREEKRLQREEGKRKTIEARDAKKHTNEAKKRTNAERRIGRAHPSTRPASGTADRRREADVNAASTVGESMEMSSSSAISGATYSGKKRTVQMRNMTGESRVAMTKLSGNLSSFVPSRDVHPMLGTRKRKHDKDEEGRTNGVLLDPKGKATKHSTLREDSKELQPRVRDYNGQGLVRPSLYISFRDPSYVPKVTSEFEEHVEGFFGKAKSKAAKKQAGANMLWRKCLDAKKGHEGAGGKGGDLKGGPVKKKRKVVTNDTRMDQRVETMIRQGKVM